LLPFTKAVPKALLPVGRKPAVQHVVEELAGVGIERVLLVVAAGQDAVGRHFTRDPELERAVRDAGREELLAALDVEPLGIEVATVVQPAPRGLADALRHAEVFAGGRPFAVALGDALFDVHGAGSTIVSRVADALDRHGAVAAIALEEVDADHVHRYGIVAPGEALDDGCVEIADVVEKPAPDAAPSRLAVAARYAFAPAIFPALAALEPAAGGEPQLADALRALIAAGERVVGVPLEPGEHRHDVGALDGYAAAFVEAALADPQLGPALRAHTIAVLDDLGAR
jgi:UTP--glucose-1-phosphate uridylyltransferase